MTEGCRLIRDFAANIAQPCKLHGLKPYLTFDGVWAIDCPKGCTRHTLEHKPHDLIVRYRATPF